MRNLLLFMLFFPLLALAGGPFFVDPNEGGFPITWKDGIVKWVADGGALNSKVSHNEAVLWVDELFKKWGTSGLKNANDADVSATTFTSQFAGSFKDDLTTENYLNSLKTKYAVIVFDSDGKITDLELGDNAHKYVVGFASPFSDGSASFAGGIVVLNGLFIDGDRNNSPEISLDEFKAAILHEIGHLLNLDHTQANIEAVSRYQDGDKSLSDEIPTMFPVLYTEDQLELHTDDTVALAQQYPSSYYLSSFCSFSGELFDEDGNPLQGADVTAYAEDGAFEFSDARTIVSGVLYPASTSHGDYVLGGLVPGRNYIVKYRGLSKNFTGGSSIAPYDPPKAGIDENIINASISCTGGSVLEIEASGSQLPDISAEGLEEDQANAPAGGCSLIP